VAELKVPACVDHRREGKVWPMAIVLFAAATLACATAGPRPITDPSQRVEAPGVSLLPPRGDDWVLLPASRSEGIPPDATLIRFAKRLPQDRVRSGCLTYTGVFALVVGGHLLLTPSGRRAAEVSQ